MGADPKSPKNKVKQSVFFVLLGSAHVKASSKTLMKYTPGAFKLFAQGCWYWKKYSTFTNIWSNWLTDHCNRVQQQQSAFNFFVKKKFLKKLHWTTHCGSILAEKDQNVLFCLSLWFLTPMGSVQRVQPSISSTLNAQIFHTKVLFGSFSPYM